MCYSILTLTSHMLCSQVQMQVTIFFSGILTQAVDCSDDPRPIAYTIVSMQVSHSIVVIVVVDFLWNRTVDSFEDKLSSTTVDFIRSEG